MSWLRTLSVLATLALSAGAFAQEDSPDERATSFQNVTGPQVEDVPGGALLIGAYGVAWLLVVAYVGRLAMLQRHTNREVDALRHTVRNASDRAS